MKFVIAVVITPLILIWASPPCDAAEVVGGFDWNHQCFGVGYDGTHLWLIDERPWITEVDFFGNATGNTIPDPPGTDPNDMAWDGTAWWITDWITSYVYHYSADGSVLSSFPGPDGQRMVGVTFDGADLWLSSFFTSKVYRVTTSGTVLESFEMPVGTELVGIGYDDESPGGPYLWAASQSSSPTGRDEIYQLTLGGSVISSFDSPTAVQNDVFGLDWDGSTIWLDCQLTLHYYQIDPQLLPVPTSTATPSPLTPTVTTAGSSTVTPVSSSTRTSTPISTLTPSETPTPTVSPQVTTTITATLTPVAIQITLDMPSDSYTEGDQCYLELDIVNPGADRSADLYVLLDVFSDYWAYPSWRHIGTGLDFQSLAVPAGDDTLTLIPEFLMPPVFPAGPLYFYAAMFEPGTLSLETLVSNGAVREFYLE